MRKIVEGQDRFKKVGLIPVGISVDAPEQVALLAEVLAVPFPLLSDQDLTVHKLFNVLNVLDTETVARYEKWKLNIEDWSEREHHTIAIPSVFLIDENRMVRWAHAAHDHRTRPTVEQILSGATMALSDQ